MKSCRILKLKLIRLRNIHFFFLIFGHFHYIGPNVPFVLALYRCLTTELFQIDFCFLLSFFYFGYVEKFKTSPLIWQPLWQCSITSCFRLDTDSFNFFTTLYNSAFSPLRSFTFPSN